MHRLIRPQFMKLMQFMIGVILTGLGAGQYAQSGELSGKASIEYRSFPKAGINAEQRQHYLLFSIEPEYYISWNSGQQNVVVAPYLRLDQHDDRRTHLDIREFYWQYAADSWELKVGLSKVFWGVTESVHLVDIINQTDLVENPDGEDKLNQPMANLTLIKNWGTIDLLLLPVFRERTFPGLEGRLRLPYKVETNQAKYESDAKRFHTDWAVRWFHTIGAFDIGIAHFNGTGREPILKPDINSGELKIIPYYQQIDQTSLDLQATKGSWLWKLELVSRGFKDGRYTAAAAGFEYTLYGILGTPYDLGILSEYLFDDRGAGSPNPFDDDIFLGFRLGFNDVQSTSLLAGAITDRVTGSSAIFIEADRRIGDSWKLELELRAFVGADINDPLFALRDDDFLQISLARYF